MSKLENNSPQYPGENLYITNGSVISSLGNQFLINANVYGRLELGPNKEKTEDGDGYLCVDAEQEI